MMRENNKPDSFSEANFKYLNKNDIEDMYYLCLNKKVNYRENTINLTAPTLTFPGIGACDPYSIVDKPQLSLIYLNNKEEKRVMDLIEIVKFCDAMLERVLKEVKTKIFENRNENVGVVREWKTNSTDDEASEWDRFVRQHEEEKSNSDKRMIRKVRVIGNALDVVIRIISSANVQSHHEIRSREHFLEVLGAIVKVRSRTKPTKKNVSWLNHQMR
ncbi:hypothetical protein Tco_0209299 [Tanacetum coccineum]